MSTAVDILALAGMVQTLAITGAGLVFGLKIIPQLRVAPPAKQPEAPKDDQADTQKDPAAGDDERHPVLELGRTGS